MNVDTRCFVTRRHLFEHHDRKPPRGSPREPAPTRPVCGSSATRSGSLPGLVRSPSATGTQGPRRRKTRLMAATSFCTIRLTAPVRKIRQTYELGEEVLLLACSAATMRSTCWRPRSSSVPITTYRSAIPTFSTASAAGSRSLRRISNSPVLGTRIRPRIGIVCNPAEFFETVRRHDGTTPTARRRASYEITDK